MAMAAAAPLAAAAADLARNVRRDGISLTLVCIVCVCWRSFGMCADGVVYVRIFLCCVLVVLCCPQEREVLE